MSLVIEEVDFAEPPRRDHALVYPPVSRLPSAGSIEVAIQAPVNAVTSREVSPRNQLLIPRGDLHRDPHGHLVRPGSTLPFLSARVRVARQVGMLEAFRAGDRDLSHADAVLLDEMPQ